MNGVVAELWIMIETALALQPLSIVIFLPLATALALVVSGGAASFLLRSDGLSPTVWKTAGLLGSTATFGLMAALLWSGFDPQQPGFQLVEHRPWLPGLGIHYFVGLDGIGLVFVALTTLLVPLVLAASWNEIDHSRRSWVLFVLVLETAALGAFSSLNLVQFQIFWEALVIPVCFVIGIWGGARRVRAAVRLFLFMAVGSVAMLLAVLVLHQLNFEQGGVRTFDLVAVEGSRAMPLLETVIPGPGEAPWWRTGGALFAGFALAFAIRAPMLPFHGWLPDAHVQAPTGGSVLMAAVLLELGAFGFLRFALPLFPVTAVALAPWGLALAIAGILHGSLVAMVQRDPKRLVAYASIAQLGFVMLGIFSVSLHGLVGSVVALVSHGLATTAVLLLVGFVQERRGTRDLQALGGLGRPMPVFAALLVVAAMTSIGLPFLSGFVGELLILLGSFASSPTAAAFAMGGVLLFGLAMLRLLSRVVLGPLDDPANRGLIDLGWRERSVVLVLVGVIVWVGTTPEPLLRRIEPTAVDLLATMRGRGAAIPTDPSPKSLASAELAARVGVPGEGP